MKSIAELEAVKARALEEIRLRQSGEVPRIVVGMGTCGIAAGAREVVAAILDELGRRHLHAVVTQTGCVGLCAREPLVDVIIPGQLRVTYGDVTPARARHIVVQHVANGRVVGEWALNYRERQ